MDKVNVDIIKVPSGKLVVKHHQHIKVPKIFNNTCYWNGIVYGSKNSVYSPLCFYTKGVKIPLTKKQSERLLSFREEILKAIQTKNDVVACDKDYETFLGVKENVDYSI